ncbi:uncharacterized protein LOC111628222 [Centruroides sculpturatus]|uniref:uncharacterized protein LOC111628222 n=1 Tax=Centruroides sculpturatus TaxID=218467 RepID=UPI000C6EDA25|nr:uncharacterized protein LOC111628222 [Centruroides sculpturatus]
MSLENVVDGVKECHELVELGTEAAELDTQNILHEERKTIANRLVLLYLKITLLSVGIVTSFTFFIVFFVNGNYHGGTAALISGIIGSCVFHIIVLIIRERLEDWYDVKILTNIQLFALLTTVCSLIAMGIYLYLAVTGYHESMSRSFYTSIIFIFLVIVWNFLLFWIIKQQIAINKEETEK